MISTKQRIHLMADCWNPACKAQGWKAGDRAFRLQKFSEILGRPLASSNDIERLKEFGQLKAALLRLADKLQGAMEVDHPEIDERRRLLDVIADHFKCARVYDPTDAYLKSVLAPRFKIVDGWSAIDDLAVAPTIRKNWKTKELEEGPSELLQCVYTIARCVNDLRNKNGDTGHEMCVKARVFCKCAQCAKHGQVLADGHSAPAHEKVSESEVSAELVHAGERDPENEPF